jgi:hypothetical protein
MVWLIEPRFSSGRTGVSMAEQIVYVIRCVDAGGATTVPAGSQIVLVFGWKAKNHGLVQAFINAQTTTISLNNGTPINVSGSYSAIEPLPPGVEPLGGSISRVRYDTGVTLSAGESLQVDGTVVVSHRVIDLFEEDTNRPVFFEPGDQQSFSCLITAA